MGKQYLTTDYLAAYDDHNYVEYAGVAGTKDAYLQHSCNDARAGHSPVFVGEWSLSVADDLESTSDWDPRKDANKDFYRNFWAAQVMSYEKTAHSWVFWTWKTTGLYDPRWDYQMAVEAGIIDRNIDNAYTMGACS